MRSIACLGMAVTDLLVGPLDKFHFDQDVTPVKDMNIKAGGDASNVALNLAAMETPISLFAKIGTDLFGQWLNDYYQKQGISTKELILSKKDKTAVAITLIDNNAERVFIYLGGANDTFTLNDINMSSLLNHDIVHTSGFYLLPSLEQSGLNEIYHTAKQQGKITCLDVGWNSQGDWFEKIKHILPQLTYFVPTINEAQQISGYDSIEDCAQFFIDQGVENVVIKSGAKGAFINDGQEKYWMLGNKVDNVIDTTGAGDGFVSGFLAGIARGYDIRRSVQLANNAGAIVVQQYGSTGAFKSFNDIEKK